MGSGTGLAGIGASIMNGSKVPKLPNLRQSINQPRPTQLIDDSLLTNTGVFSTKDPMTVLVFTFPLCQFVIE